MIKTMKFKRILGAVTAAALSLSAVSFAVVTANADNDTATSTYTLTIPSTLNVENPGWNSIGNISATGELANGKKLKIEASSDNDFALVNTSDSSQKVSYTIKNTSEDTDATTSWEFDSLDAATPTEKAIGIDVEDYSDKPAGTYTDGVTFKASVESAAPEYAELLSAGLTITDDIINNYAWSNNIFGQVGFTSSGSSREWYAQTITEQQAVALAQYKGSMSMVVYEKGEGSDNGYGDKEALWKIAKNDGTIVGIESSTYIKDDPEILKGYTVYYIPDASILSGGHTYSAATHGADLDQLFGDDAAKCFNDIYLKKNIPEANGINLAQNLGDKSIVLSRTWYEQDNSTTYVYAKNDGGNVTSGRFHLTQDEMSQFDGYVFYAGKSE